MLALETAFACNRPQLMATVVDGADFAIQRTRHPRRAVQARKDISARIAAIRHFDVDRRTICKAIAVVAPTAAAITRSSSGLATSIDTIALKTHASSCVVGE